MSVATRLHSLYQQLKMRIYAKRASRVFEGLPLGDIHRANRESLSQIPHWIDDHTWKNSVFQYGLPESVRHLIDSDIGEATTYTDVILGLAGRLRKPVRYLEIGVSVGKTFFQISRYLKNADLVAFDIEEINPVLRDQFSVASRTEWPTFAGSIKKAHSSLTTLAQDPDTNRVAYLSGDVFDEANWKRLARNGPFNLIFSDALHTPEALLHEYEMLTKFDLLDQDQLVIAWDDLGGGMIQAYEQNCLRLKEARPGKPSSHFIVLLRGWLGENEPEHAVGFFVSL